MAEWKEIITTTTCDYLTMLKYFPSEYILNYRVHFLKNIMFWSELGRETILSYAENLPQQSFQIQAISLQALTSGVRSFFYAHDNELRVLTTAFCALMAVIYVILIFWYDLDEEPHVVVYKYGEKLPFRKEHHPTNSPSAVRRHGNSAVEANTPILGINDSINFSDRQQEIDFEVRSASLQYFNDHCTVFCVCIYYLYDIIEQLSFYSDCFLC